MDIFNEITIKHHRLDLVFPVITNSCDYGLLKQDYQGKLFDIAVSQLGLKASDYSSVLLIDNSEKGIRVFENKGGVGYLYKTFAEFDKWANSHLLDELIERS